MNSTRYILFFVLTMTTIVALLLTTLYSGWKAKSDENEAIFNKRAILSAVQSKLDEDVKKMGDQDILDIFDQKMQQYVLDMEGADVSMDEVESLGYKGGKAENIDMNKDEKRDELDRILPLFIYDDGKSKNYIIHVRGNGLWDKIWGNIALGSDFNTIVGAAFDHKGETPGLGAEIKDNPAFAKQFEGRKIYDSKGEYVSIFVRKGGAKDMSNEVDGISGATITCDGVTEMMERGIGYYLPFFERLEANDGKMGMK